MTLAACLVGLVGWRFAFHWLLALSAQRIEQ